jgi:uncharacterized HAD superfamily protein/hypoxanthine phosphoribosyltransferase
MSRPLVNYRTFHDLIRIIQENIWEISSDYDLVVGIPRSGIIPANMIALLKHLPFTDIDGLIQERLYSSGFRLGQDSEFFKRPLNILIVDDSIFTGNQLQATKTYLQKHLEDKPYRISYCAIYSTREGASQVDQYLEIVPPPRIFSWNILHSSIYKVSCVDLDGVLCVDPTPEQNDDGAAYLDFLQNAAPLVKPTEKIKTIVTSRLEKYRAPTQDWLAQNEIEYDNLIMLDLPSAEERRRLKIHARFKAEVYGRSDAIMFIESTPWQAKEIHSLSQKPVFCVETHEMYEETSQKEYIKFRYREAKTNLILLPHAIERAIKKRLKRLKQKG